MSLDDDDMRTEAHDPFDGPADGGADPDAHDGGADGSAGQPGKLREIFGSGSLTGGAATGGTGGTGGLGTGAGDMSGGSSQILGQDPNTGGRDGVDDSGAGPV
jgi:hypothetical protein